MPEPFKTDVAQDVREGLNLPVRRRMFQPSGDILAIVHLGGDAGEIVATFSGFDSVGALRMAASPIPTLRQIPQAAFIRIELQFLCRTARSGWIFSTSWNFRSASA
jgi:hypothetical protein